MSQKSAVRFVVEIAGQLKRILSIRERTNGDLNLTVHSSGTLGVHERGADPKAIKESRYSIHVTPGDPGNQVKGTIEYNDGTKVFRHLFTNALTLGNVQPIFIHSLIHPAFLQTLTAPAKGPVVTLPEYDPARWTMYYALWVCSPEVGRANSLQSGPYSLVRWAFKRFTIFVPFCFVPAPSSATAKIWEFGTTTLEHRTPEHVELGGRVGPAEGITVRSAAGTATWLFNQLIARREDFAGMTADWPPPLGFHIAHFFPLSDFPNDLSR